MCVCGIYICIRNSASSTTYQWKLQGVLVYDHIVLRYTIDIQYIHHYIHTDIVYIQNIYTYSIYRVFQEEWTKLREGVPDITKNTYFQIWTVTEIKARDKCGLLVVPHTVPGSHDVVPIRCALSVLVYSWLKHIPCCDCTCIVLGNPKDNYDMSASVFVVQFNGFMSLTSYFDVKYRY